MRRRQWILLAAVCVSLLLALALHAAAADGVNAALFAAPRSGQFPDGGSWNIDTNGVLTVGGTDCIYADADSFNQWTDITGLVVEPGVQEFSHWFNRYENLVSVKLPVGMTYCPTFYWCPNLKTVELPADMTQL